MCEVLASWLYLTVLRALLGGCHHDVVDEGAACALAILIAPNNAKYDVTCLKQKRVELGRGKGMKASERCVD